ncbi:MAG: hypothetical protein K0R89_1044, partial [Ramlibacter sp.]|nr:hypothetical protein [Ramlibacter sp.]
MTPDPFYSYSAFAGSRKIASGSLEDVAAAVALASARSDATVLVFSDDSGAQVDLDLRGTEADVRARHRPAPPAEAAPRGRGRPRLGVVAREVTLLPDQWEWLAAQPGGASVALRKLVLEARRAGTLRDRMRRAQERSYKVMVALAGDRPGFEAASRALFAGDLDAFRAGVARWPRDIRDHLLQLANPDHDPTPRS